MKILMWIQKTRRILLGMKNMERTTKAVKLVKDTMIVFKTVLKTEFGGEVGIEEVNIATEEEIVGSSMLLVIG
jgi:hypothetical protein